MLTASLSDNVGRLIAKGCPLNLRKIKRILNLIYFLAKGTEEEAFAKDFPLIVIWSIATVAYPELARLINMDPYSLFATVDWLKGRISKGGILENRGYFLSDRMSSEYSDRIVSDAKHKYLIQPIIAIASRDFSPLQLFRIYG